MTRVAATGESGPVARHESTRTVGEADCLSIRVLSRSVGCRALAAIRQLGPVSGDAHHEAMCGEGEVSVSQFSTAYPAWRVRQKALTAPRQPGPVESSGKQTNGVVGLNVNQSGFRGDHLKAGSLLPKRVPQACEFLGPEAESGNRKAV